MSFEKYRPSKGEIEKAEEMMTDMEKSATRERLLGIEEKRLEIPDATPLDEGPLLEVRRDQVEVVKQALDKNDQLVLGIAPRTGSTSAMKLLENMYKQEGVSAIEVLSYNPSEIRKEILREKGSDKDKKIIVIVDEANQFLDFQKDAEGGDREAERTLDEINEIFGKSRQQNVKFVFLSHDTYGENGEGGVNAMKDFLNKISAGTEVKTADMQLETLDKQGLGKVFDILVKENVLPPELIERREDILSLSTTPQQISLIVREYLNAIKGGKDDAGAWENATRLDYGGMIENSMKDLIRICGREHMKKLLKKAAEEGSLPLNDLDEKEKKLYERYRKFHIFEEEGDKIRINGKMLEDLVKQGRIK